MAESDYYCKGCGRLGTRCECDENIAAAAMDVFENAVVDGVAGSGRLHVIVSEDIWRALVKACVAAKEATYG